VGQSMDELWTLESVHQRKADRVVSPFFILRGHELGHGRLPAPARRDMDVPSASVVRGIYLFWSVTRITQVKLAYGLL